VGHLFAHAVSDGGWRSSAGRLIFGAVG
jgi:hypothetical protein